MSMKKILITGGSGFIGTNLIKQLGVDAGVNVSSLDIAPPKRGDDMPVWQQVDLRDGAALDMAVRAFQPDAVIHLAARTDLEGRKISDYSSNTEGTSRLLEALDSADFKGPAIFTSSMYVCRPGYRPSSDTDYQPHTVYGESKVLGEELVRAANPSYPWIITRPTSIWGPWFGVPYIDFFKIVLSGRYLHIAKDRTQKTYGYVGNTVAQILKIIEHPDALKGRTLYLGDWPATVITEWSDEIAAFVPYRVPRAPRVAFNALAFVGDALQGVGVRFPMTSFRLQNMTTDNVHDLSPLQSLMGSLPFTRAQGNELTVQWIRDHAQQSRNLG